MTDPSGDAYGHYVPVAPEGGELRNPRDEWAEHVAGEIVSALEPCRHDMGWRDITPPPATGGMWWECNRCHTVCHECGPGSCYKIEGLK